MKFRLPCTVAAVVVVVIAVTIANVVTATASCGVGLQTAVKQNLYRWGLEVSKYKREVIKQNLDFHAVYNGGPCILMKVVMQQC